MLKSKKTSKTNRNSRNCTTCLAILNCVKAGINYSAQVSKELKKKPQTIHYNLRVLEDRGYIRRATGDKRSYPVIYELSDKGLILLSNAERLARGALRFHHYALKYRVEVDNPSFLPIEGGARLRGGVLEVTGTVDGYTVRRWHAPTGDYLYLFSRPLWGRFPWQLLAFASIDVHTLSHLIEQRYRMQLKYEGVLQKPHLSDPKDPLSQRIFEYGSKAAILIAETEAGNATAGPQFNEGKFVHLLLNQCGYGTEREAWFHFEELVARLEILYSGYNLDIVNQKHRRIFKELWDSFAQPIAELVRRRIVEP